ncbi:MAG: TonB-dependent receptor [Steroidobacteraceae bacterium]
MVHGSKWLVAVVCGLMISPILQAQGIQEVVITAQKREQSINDVGITVNAFTGDQLKDAGLRAAEDIAQFTPGLTVNATAATGVPVYTIRGVGFQDYSTAASSTVGLYFDQVAMPYTVASRGVAFDIERVEVLKGPQGDLYGRNTTAGQINFISKMPTKTFQAGVTAGLGSFSTYNLEGFISGPMGERARGRLAVRTDQSSDGWQKSLTRNDKLGKLDTKALRAMVEFDLSDAATLLLKAQYVDDQSENLANTAYNGQLAGLGEFNLPYTPLDQYLLPTGANFGQVPPWYSTDNNRAADWTNSYTSPITGRTFNLRPQRDNQLKSVAATLNWDINGYKLTSITSFDQFDRVESNDWDGCFCNDSSNINTTDLSMFSEELRVTRESEQLLWIAGVYYSTDDMDEYYHYFMSDSVFGEGSIPWGVGLFAPTPILELDTKYRQKTDSAAVFGHVEWKFADRWRATIGARYTQEKRDWSGCTFSAEDGTLGAFLNAQFGSTLAPGDCGTIDDDPNSPTYIFALIGGPNVNDAFHVYTDKIDTKRWMGKLGLDFAVNDDVLIYGTISNGFKSGGFNGANSNTTLQLKPYKEEVLTSFEVGTKATLAEGRAQLNVAAFYYDYKDKQEQDSAVTFVGNIAGLANVPKSRIQGAEINLDWAPTDALHLSFGAAFLDTEITEWMAVDRTLSSWPTVVRTDASGVELAQSPKVQLNAMLGYQWHVAGERVVDLSFDAAYKDKTTGGVQTTDATDSYTLVNARLGFGSADGRWRAMVWGRNLTDEYYYPAAYVGGNGPLIRSVGMPRTYGISVDYRFGN